MTVADSAPGRLRFGLHVPNLAEPATLVELGEQEMMANLQLDRELVELLERDKVA